MLKYRIFVFGFIKFVFGMCIFPKIARYCLYSWQLSNRNKS